MTTEQPEARDAVRGQVAEVRDRLVAMGSMVESLMADSLVALLDANRAAVPELREEDCRTHEQWLEVDKHCTRLLAEGGLDAEQVHFITAAIKIAGALKRAGDETLRVAESTRTCPDDSLTTAKTMASIPRLAEVAQGMLSDLVGALANGDPTQAEGLHIAFRELAAQRKIAVAELAEAMASDSIEAMVGVTLVGVSGNLERIGDEVVDAANHLRHVALRNQQGG